MNARLLHVYLRALEGILPALERAAYLNTDTRQTGARLTLAREQIQAARRALPANTGPRR